MPISSTPRSVSDATRFTATTPHASSKAAAGSRFTPPSNAPAGGAGGEPKGAPMSETPAQRVQRLRAAHLRAKAAQGSRFDRVIEMGRRIFDSAHKATVVGLVGLTAITGLVTVYTAVDMLAFNRKRRNEFIEAQKAMEADSLEAARLAYMTNKATEEQIQLVEEANAREMAADSHIFKMPAVIGAPRPAGADSQPSSVPLSSATADQGAEAPAGQKQGGLGSWLFGSLKKQDEGLSGAKPQSLSEQAKQAFENERVNQRNGGPLDRVGLAEQPAAEPKKKGWW
ncbi:hypothetical protein GQ53DRAFT_695830 [Thozetella sp. PMI_491]|nr:hypothetical protein GQ53DRAFT_695830 [Thozetella sp. PMI_491]